jgi:Na+/H+ antiporter NhaD/arsenite permease-like protein
MSLSVPILLAVLVLIAFRRVGGIRLRIWQIMLGGALACLLLGEVTPSAALSSINPDVMLFLFGMFVVGEALDMSGYLAWLSYRVFRHGRTPAQLMLLFMFVVGFASAFLMNDTLAIVGTPVALALAARHRLPPKMMLLSLAFAVTIGGVASPIGNPQNLLIAVGGLSGNPFLQFARYLLVPTILNLAVTYAVLRIFWPDAFRARRLTDEAPPLADSRLAMLCKVALLVMLSLILLKVSLAFLGVNADFRLTSIALASSAPILLLSRRRLKILANIDWRTLVFFASMFVLMGSVWGSGFVQAELNGLSPSVKSTGMILASGILMSQLVSNVPLVALYLPLLLKAGASAKELAALAAGSTIAGNLTIMGAASNVIIIQNAEKRGETLTFWEFAKVGVPLTALNVLVFWLYLSLFG